MAEGYIGMGYVQSGLLNIEESLRYEKKAEKIYQELGINKDKDLVSLYANMACNYRCIDNFGKEKNIRKKHWIFRLKLQEKILFYQQNS